MQLTIGRLYVVYAVEIIDGWVRYYVADDVYPNVSYPVGYFAAFFEIVDPRVSGCWTFKCTQPRSRSPNTLLAFENWAQEPLFYENLVDGGAREWEIFRDRKEFMDLEFPDPSLAAVAEAVDIGWLLCPRCSEAWESDEHQGLVRCPRCNTVLNNPRFA
jgi:hypothetical protein